MPVYVQPAMAKSHSYMVKSHTTSFGTKSLYNQLWQSHLLQWSYGKITCFSEVMAKSLASVKLWQSLALDPTMLLHLGWSQKSYGTTVPHNPAVKMIHHIWLKKKYFLLPCGHVQGDSNCFSAGNSAHIGWCQVACFLVFINQWLTYACLKCQKHWLLCSMYRQAHFI